ncbi:MAG TPA: DapH/DapD/GlmU-related protein [Vicinamibacterales bacterium]|nr:DapH/DapD/GlmU-related protein [Vicinamibacterales bacterium]
MISELRHSLSRSDHRLAHVARRTRRFVSTFTLPAVSGRLARPALWLFLAVRGVAFYLYRVFVCEPLFKASCRSCGRGVRTDVYIHWIQGRGNLIVGDDVLMDGKCSITFAARYASDPTLTIGDHSGIGHGCRFSIGKRITIGRHCRIASDVWMFDSSGHPLDAEARRAGLAAADADVRPITIGDNVWIGGRAIIHPGVTIGDHAVISAGAVVMNDVPPSAVVAGNPARAVMGTSRAAVERAAERERLRA